MSDSIQPSNFSLEFSSIQRGTQASLEHGADHSGVSLTNPHNHKEPRQEPSKVNHPRATALHEVIGIRGAPTDPVRQWRDHVGRNDEQGQVVVKEGGGEDD